MGARILPFKTIGEAIEKAIQARPWSANLLGIHAMSSLKPFGEDSFVKLPAAHKTNLAL
jgi:hypothetical protein